MKLFKKNPLISKLTFLNEKMDEYQEELENLINEYTTEEETENGTEKITQTENLINDKRYKNYKTKIEKTELQLKCLTYMIIKATEEIFEKELTSDTKEVDSRQYDLNHKTKKDERLTEIKFKPGSLMDNNYHSPFRFITLKKQELEDEGIQDTTEYKNIERSIIKEFAEQYDDTNEGTKNLFSSFKECFKYLLAQEKAALKNNNREKTK